MTAIILTSENYRQTKRELRERYPDIGSAHLSEAFAAALGLRTHAALLSRLEHLAKDNFPEFVVLNERAFRERLFELGYSRTQQFGPDLFEWLRISSDNSILVRTAPFSETKYRSLRDRAWRQMMIAGINAALEQRLFSLKPGDNRWPGATKDYFGHRKVHVYRFTFGADIPALGSIWDVGHDELSFHVALWPTAEGELRIGALGAGFRAGEAYAHGWLERRDGAWLESTPKSISCRAAKLRIVAATTYEPRGFGDGG